MQKTKCRSLPRDLSRHPQQPCLEPCHESQPPTFGLSSLRDLRHHTGTLLLHVDGSDVLGQRIRMRLAMIRVLSPTHTRPGRLLVRRIGAVVGFRIALFLLLLFSRLTLSSFVCFLFILGFLGALVGLELLSRSTYARGATCCINRRIASSPNEPGRVVERGARARTRRSINGFERIAARSGRCNDRRGERDGGLRIAGGESCTRVVGVDAEGTSWYRGERTRSPTGVIRVLSQAELLVRHDIIGLLLASKD
jgi:hypothetical protein